jgi:hypothetical protein
MSPDYVAAFCGIHFNRASMRTLNLAIPIASLFGFTVGMVIYLICAQTLVTSGMVQRTAEDISGWVALFLTVAIALFFARRKVSMLEAPTQKTESGHTLLAVANTAALLTTVVPLAASFVGDPSTGTTCGSFFRFCLSTFSYGL